MGRRQAEMQVRRITINGRTFVLTDPIAEARMLTTIEAAVSGPPAWVTIPIRQEHQPQVLVTAAVDCFLEVLDVPDEEPEDEGAEQFFSFEWPMDL
jgi:hypothetical protein